MISLTSAIAAATAAFAGHGFWRYFGPVAAPGLWALLLLTVAALVCLGAGLRALKSLGLSSLDAPERALAALTLGLGILSSGLFLLAAAGLLSPAGASLLAAGMLVVGVRELRRLAADWGPSVFKTQPTLSAGGLVLAWLLPLWACLIPPHQYDSLVYHLTLPQAYARSGNFSALPHLLYSHFPQNAEMLFSLGILWRCDLLAQMFMWLAAVLSACWLYTAARRELGSGAALVACGLLSTHTAVLLLASTSYIESLVMLWIAAAVFAFARWRDGDDAAAAGWLKFSALCSGLALGTKYTAGVSAGLLGIFLVLRCVLSDEVSRGRRLKEAALFVGITSALFTPWLVKNAWEVGNPIFPFFYEWFPMTGTGWNAETARGYFNVFTEYNHRAGWLLDLLELPQLLLSNSLRFGGGMDVLGDLGWDILFWCLPLAVWAARSSLYVRRLLIYTSAYLALWFATGVVMRFLTAIVPLLCFLAAAGLSRLWERLGTAGRATVGTAVGLLMLAHLGLFFYVHAVFGGQSVLVGLENREEFLSRRLDYYPCASYAAGHLGQNDKILIVGEQRAYYVTQDHVASTVHAPNPYVGWANDSSSPQDLAQRLVNEGFTHLLAVPAEARRLGPALGRFTPRGQSHWEGLQRGPLKLVHAARACALFQIDAQSSPR